MRNGYNDWGKVIKFPGYDKVISTYKPSISDFFYT